MFESRSRINFYECDPAGVIFYANIFKLAHKVYEEFIDSLGLKNNIFSDEEIAIPIVNAEANYKSPLFASSMINIVLKVTEVKESSFKLEFTFIDDDSDIKSIVSTVHVVISKSNRKKVLIPEELKKKLLSNLI